ncbi:MAG: hypothetical protein AAF580_00255 [Pseudomonadota bacterium]
MTVPRAPSLPRLASPIVLSPQPARHIPGSEVLQRLAYTTGRTLTQRAVALEQGWVDATLGVAGRRLSAGVLTGLRVSVPDQAEEAGRFVISAGAAIAPGGQDVLLSTAQTVSLTELSQIGTVSGVGNVPEGPAVIVLEPVTIAASRQSEQVDRTGAFADQCPPDPAALPFQTFVQRDGARIVWAPVTVDLTGVTEIRVANIAAESVRQQEAADPLSLPWSTSGVPLALMWVDNLGRIVWHHQAAVVRRGGQLPMAALGGTHGIAQSRLAGLVEELAIATRRYGFTGAQGARFLRHMPPGGVLTKRAWESRAFFPATWAQAPAPIPASQLDAVLEATRAMAPFDLDRPRDRVKWLIPVPDVLYDPDLLAPPSEPDFTEIRTPLRTAVANARAVRNALRGFAPGVQGAIDAAARTDFAALDDDPVPNETGFVPNGAVMPDNYADMAFRVLDRSSDLRQAPLFTPEQRQLLAPTGFDTAPPPYGITPFIETMRAVVETANDTIDFAFSRVQTEIYRVRQLMLGEEEATRLATFPVLAGLAKGSSHYAVSEGLRAQFIAEPPAGPTQPDPPDVDAGRPSGGTNIDFGLFAGDLLSGAPAGEALFLRSARDAITIAVDDGPTVQPPRGERVVGNFLGRVGSTPDRFDVGVALDAVSFTGNQSFADERTSFAFGALLEQSAITTSTATIKAIVDNTRANLVDDAVLREVAAKKSGIRRAAPIPGEIRDSRSSTIAERLKPSVALTAKSSAVRIKADVLRQLQALDLSLELLAAPLSSNRTVALLLNDDVEAEIAAAGLNAAETAQFQRLRRQVEDTGAGPRWELLNLVLPEPTGDSGTVRLPALARLADNLRRRRAPIDMGLLPVLTLAKALDPDPEVRPGTTDADDEAAFLDAAIATLESVVALLRIVEARVSAVAANVWQMEQLVPELKDIERRWRDALNAADRDLAEARHDWRVAESLIAEETARRAAQAAERARILTEEVEVVAYVRPRALQPHDKGDTLGLSLPGTAEDPVPALLRRDATLPDDLLRMMGALREMPIGWFAAPGLTATFNNPRQLADLYGGAVTRAQFKTASGPAANARQVQAVRSGSSARVAAATVAAGYETLSYQVVASRAALNRQSYFAASWSDRRRRALADLSLNDLIESGQDRRAARVALDEVEGIERVLAGMLDRLAALPPTIRLGFAFELSVFDAAVDLSNLSRLPNFAAVDVRLRNTLLRLNAWLFARMAKGNDEARAIMSDLVRVAILTAAHASTAELVTARVEVEQSVRQGSALDIVIRRGNPRIGMEIAVFQGGAVSGRGTIADLKGGRAKVAMTVVAGGVATFAPTADLVLYERGALRAAAG